MARFLRFRLAAFFILVGLGVATGGSVGIAPAYGGDARGAGLAMILVGVGLLATVFFEVRRGSVPKEQKWERTVDGAMFMGTAGNWDQALAEMHKALAMAGSDPRRLRASTRISQYLEAHQRPADAVPFLLDSLTATTHMFGEIHPDTLQLREHLSDVYLGLGDTASAAELMREQVAALSVSGRASSVEAARASARLAAAVQAQGDPAGAEAASAQAVAVIAAIDPHSIELVDPLLVTARVAAGRGDMTAAESMLDRALDCARRVGDRGKELKILQQRIDFYLAEGRYAEAIPISATLLNEATTLQKNANLIDTARLNRQHADLLEQAGQTDEAARRRKVADLLEGMAARSG